MTYPLGWPVIRQISLRRERWPGGYGVLSTPLVSPGQEVLPDQPILRVRKIQQAESAQSAPRLSLPSASEVQPPRDGDQDGAILPAGLSGRVTRITRRGGVEIESQAAVVQGSIGAGHQVVGVLTLWQGGKASQVIPPGAVLVVPGPLNFTLLRQVMSSSITGIVASSISQPDLEGFLRADLLQLLTSADVAHAQAHLPPLTLLFTEGIGSFAMATRTINLLSSYQGSIALLSGITSLRQQIFPELLISLSVAETRQNWQPVPTPLTPVVGAEVRVCGGEHTGATGVIDYLFTYQHTFVSGIRARAARLFLEDGSLLVVPMTLIERVG